MKEGGKGWVVKEGAACLVWLFFGGWLGVGGGGGLGGGVWCWWVCGGWVSIKKKRG